MRLGALIFGQAHDPHVDAVALRLRALGVEVLVFDQFRDQTAIAFDAESGRLRWPYMDWLSSLDGAVVWSRVKSPKGPDIHPAFELNISADAPAGPYQTQLHWRSEWHHFSRSLIRAIRLKLPHIRVINPGIWSQDAEYKPIQLEVATQLGLAIPHTVIGNDKEAIGCAFDQTVLYKPISGTPVGGIGIPPPATLPKQVILGNDYVSVAPAIYQQTVVKLYELRIVCAGDTSCAVKIDSQKLNISKSDWRLAQHRSDIYSPTTVPDTLSQKLLEYLIAMELDIGSFDFAVDSDGRHIFFECNPGGQWLWLEPHVRMPMTEAVSACLFSLAQKSASGEGQKRLAAAPSA